MAKEQQTAVVVATYCDWDHARKCFTPHMYGNSSYRLPARVTDRSYIIRYGGEGEDMEAGKGNVRKILPRFRRHTRGEARTSWRHYIGSHERDTRAVIKFEVEAVNIPTSPV